MIVKLDIAVVRKGPAEKQVNVFKQKPNLVSGSRFLADSLNEVCDKRGCLAEFLDLVLFVVSLEVDVLESFRQQFV